MRLQPSHAESLNAFFDLPTVKFSEEGVDINGVKLDFTDAEKGPSMLKKTDALACLLKLEQEMAKPEEGMAYNREYLNELWTRFLRYLVKNPDEYRWTVKLFSDFPSLQFPYFYFGVLKEYGEAPKEIKDKAVQAVKFAKAYVFPKA